MDEFMQFSGKDGKNVELDPDSIVGFIDHGKSGCEILLAGLKIMVDESLDSVKERLGEWYEEAGEDDDFEEEEEGEDFR